MTQKATSDELTPVQVKVLGLLISGSTISDAAEQAGVDRSTIHRWRKTDMGFVAALNRERRAVREEMESHLLRLAEKASGVVEAAIETGDVNVALAVLKGTGLLSGRTAPIGLDDARELEVTKGERESVLAMRELLVR